jgi:hypothetical protein
MASSLLFARLGQFINMTMAEELKSERVTTMMTPAEVKAVDDWSFAHRIRSRGEAIRQLIQLGLEAAKRSGAKPKGKKP